MILNLTQHPATPEQKAAGVVDFPQAEREMLVKLLTFDTLPSREEIENRAFDLAELACYNGLNGDEGDDPIIFTAMIGGAPYLMKWRRRYRQHTPSFWGGSFGQL